MLHIAMNSLVQVKSFQVSSSHRFNADRAILSSLSTVLNVIRVKKLITLRVKHLIKLLQRSKRIPTNRPFSHKIPHISISINARINITTIAIAITMAIDIARIAMAMVITMA